MPIIQTENLIVNGDEFRVETGVDSQCTNVGVTFAAPNQPGSLAIDFAGRDGSFDYETNVRYTAPAGIIADAALLQAINDVEVFEKR